MAIAVVFGLTYHKDLGHTANPEDSASIGHKGRVFVNYSVPSREESLTVVGDTGSYTRLGRRRRRRREVGERGEARWNRATSGKEAE